jgi:sialate O-acetylesterase
LFKVLKIEDGKIRLAFDHTGTGLMVGKKEGRNPAVETPGEKLKQFAIAGADRKWFWADAVIVNNTVTVSSPVVKEPVAVRYAFQMNPDGANLYNREGLPASPFRTDDW